MILICLRNLNLRNCKSQRCRRRTSLGNKIGMAKGMEMRRISVGERFKSLVLVQWLLLRGALSELWIGMSMRTTRSIHLINFKIKSLLTTSITTLPLLISLNSLMKIGKGRLKKPKRLRARPQTRDIWLKKEANKRSESMTKKRKCFTQEWSDQMTS